MEDLSSVQTEKLFELLLKYLAKLKEEELPIVFTKEKDMETSIIDMLGSQKVTWKA